MEILLLLIFHLSHLSTSSDRIMRDLTGKRTQELFQHLAIHFVVEEIGPLQNRKKNLHSIFEPPY